MHNHKELSVFTDVNLFAINNEPSEQPLTSLPSFEPSQLKSFAGSHIRQNKKMSRSKTPSDIIKENILKRRESKRIQQLKQVTSKNLDMFMRIRSQTSHYKYKDLHGQSQSKLIQRHSSQPKLKLRSQTQNPTLLSRCASLKQHIVNRTQQNKTQIQTQPKKEAQIKTILFKRKISNNKQNQQENGIKDNSNKLIPNKQIEQRIIAKKLGQPLQQLNKMRIVITSEGNPISQIRKKQKNNYVQVRQNVKNTNIRLMTPNQGNGSSSYRVISRPTSALIYQDCAVKQLQTE